MGQSGEEKRWETTSLSRLRGEKRALSLPLSSSEEVDGAHIVINNNKKRGGKIEKGGWRADSLLR